MSVLTQKKQQLVAENPFYGKKATLNLLQQLPKVDDKTVQKQVVFNYLSLAWVELKNSKAERELFFTLIFSIGDIANREHNLFSKYKMKDIDQGGHSKRRTFIFCLEWMLANIPEQFYKFLPIIGEYYNLDGMMMYELRTDRFKGTLLETLKLPINVDVITKYISSVLLDTKTTLNEKKMWAKWLPHIPSAKRTRKYDITEKNIKAFTKGGSSDRSISLGDRITVNKEKKSYTQEKDNWSFAFIKSLSNKMDWEVIKHKKNIEFVGYKNFKKAYLGDTEARMFSQQGIKQLDKVQLIEWFNQLPSDARFRVSKRLVNKDKSTGALTADNKWISNNGTNIGEVYIEWLKMKETAQQAVRELTPEAKAALAPTELKKMEKAAKVNTGATNLLDLFAEMLKGGQSTSQIDTIAHSILEQIKLDMPVLLVDDISGSMSSASVTHNGVHFSASAMSKLATTIFLLKNPDVSSEPFFIRFDNIAEVVYKGANMSMGSSNRFMSTKQALVEEIVDPKKPFSYNLASVGKLLTPRGGTDLSCVAKGLKTWVDSEPAFKSQRIEMINVYQVLLLVSDGDINSHPSAAQSVLAFQRDMQQWFGWAGVIVIWDVKESRSGDGSKFEGLENVMYFGGTNHGIVNQIFKNINDIDIVDTFLPLKSLSMSNRYSPVRQLTS